MYLEIDTLNITCIIHGILNVGSDGNSAVKIEEGEGQRLYLYTVEIANFRQICCRRLMERGTARCCYMATFEICSMHDIPGCHF